MVRTAAQATQTAHTAMPNDVAHAAPLRETPLHEAPLHEAPLHEAPCDISDPSSRNVLLDGGPWAVAYVKPNREKVFANALYAAILSYNADKQCNQDSQDSQDSQNSSNSFTHAQTPTQAKAQAQAQTKALAHCPWPFSYYLPLLKTRSSSRNLQITALFPGYVFVRGQYIVTSQKKRPLEFADTEIAEIGRTVLLEDFGPLKGACNSKYGERKYLIELLHAPQKDLRPVLELLMLEARTLLTNQKMPVKGQTVRVADGPLRGLVGRVADTHDTHTHDTQCAQHTEHAEHTQHTQRIFVDVALLGQVVSAEITGELEAI